MKQKQNKPKATKNLAKDVETPRLPPGIQRQANHRQVLQFLDSVTALAPVSRQTHVQVQQSFTQISKALVELEILKKEKADGKNKT